MNHAAEFRRCLEECDVTAIRKLWRYVAPQFPQPSSDYEALATIHRARTEAVWANIELRAYSHRWLLDNGLPSALPDDLKPKAERMYPKIVEGVGISVNTNSTILKPIMRTIQNEMENVVMEAYTDGKNNPALIKERMLEIKTSVTKKLLGNISGKV